MYIDKLLQYRSITRNTLTTTGTTESSPASSVSSRFINSASRFAPTRTPNLISHSTSERLRASSTMKPVVSIFKSAEEDPKRKVVSNEEAPSTKETKSEGPKKLEQPQTCKDKDDEEEITDDDSEDQKDEKDENDKITLTMISRATSPSPPSSSGFVSRRRADVARLFQKQVTRSRKRPEMKDADMQSDRMDDTARYSRFGSATTSRVSSTPWSSYLDKLASSGTSSRGYGTGTGVGSRIGSFGYTRQPENSSTTSTRCERSPPSCSQPELRVPTAPEISRDSSRSKVSGTPSPSRSPRDNSDDSSSYHSLSSNVRQPSAEVEPKISSKATSTLRTEDNNEKRRMSKLARTSPVKSDGKISRSSSKGEINGSAEPNSLSSSSSSKVQERPRTLEGQSGQKRENSAGSVGYSSSSRRDSIPRSDATSPSPNRSISRNSSAKSLPRKMTRNESSQSESGSSVSVPTGRSSKSSSAGASTSQGAKIKMTASPSGGQSPNKSVSTSQASQSVTVTANSLRPSSSSETTRGKPPVPKSDSCATMKIPNAAGKYINKDFRKSALNMENGEPNSRNSKHTDRKTCTSRDKCQRSVSVSSQDSEANSEPVQLVVSSGSSSASLKSGRSGSKLPVGEVHSEMSKYSKSTSPHSRLSVVRTSKSRSNSPLRRKKSNASVTTSSNSESSDDSSTSSSSSSDEGCNQNPAQDRNGSCSGESSKRRRKRTQSSPRLERKMSAGSSRTSILLSSADESSLTMDKPPRPPSSPRSRSDRSSKTEEAKSFLIRALAPITGSAKMKNQDSGSDGWPETDNPNEEISEYSKRLTPSPSLTKSITQSLSKSLSFTNSNISDHGRTFGQTINRQSSGEKPWWIESNSDNVPDGVERIGNPCNDEISQEGTTISTLLPDDGEYTLQPSMRFAEKLSESIHHSVPHGVVNDPRAISVITLDVW